MATHEVKLKPWQTPNFALVEQSPLARREGLTFAPSIPVADLSQEALRSLADQWLTDLYRKAGKKPDWAWTAAK